MVVFLDLEDESAEPPEHWLMHNAGVSRNLDLRNPQPSVSEERNNPNKEKAVTKALGCYPVINEIASHIDLNTLDALSSTCRQVRANLLQFRSQLITSTLHCENEDIEPDPEHTFRYRARAADWYFVESGRDALGPAGGKVGQCARDLVGGCRKCGRVICRNCAIKPPAPIQLRCRHRRICTACSKAPISTIVHPTTYAHGEHASSLLLPASLHPESIKRSICTCPSDGVWLCQPCGRSVRSDDNQYESIWRWRTRYLPSLGGLGVGIGEGNRGVSCGRAEKCVAAREVEQEIDCDAEDAREFDISSRAASPSSSPGTTHGSFNGSASGQMGPGYARHEIEGIGGVVKKKLVRMVKVGACVPEWGDEKAAGRYLGREQEGKARSWCGWCCRVVPGVKDGIE